MKIIIDYVKYCFWIMRFKAHFSEVVKIENAARAEAGIWRFSTDDYLYDWRLYSPEEAAQEVIDCFYS